MTYLSKEVGLWVRVAMANGRSFRGIGINNRYSYPLIFFPCRRLRTHWSRGRTNWSMISLLWGLTSTHSSLWIWLQRRRPPWCRCAPGLPRSSLRGKLPQIFSITWISTDPQVLHIYEESRKLPFCLFNMNGAHRHVLCLITGYARLQRPMGF